MKTLALISCCKKKALEPTWARDLYQSPLFKMSREYVEREADQYLILSAHLWVVPPSMLIYPYDESMSDKTARQRRIWAAQVVHRLEGILQDGDRLIVLAGRSYREPLLEIIERRYPNVQIEIPLEGLGIGEQLRALKEANARGATCEDRAIAGGWTEGAIGLYTHVDLPGYLLDFNGGDGDCYYVKEPNVSGIYAVFQTYDELAEFMEHAPR